MKISFFTLLLLALLWSPAASQGLLAELAAILGILPTSQILLAGGGIIGIKLAMLLRFLAIVGLIGDHTSHPPALDFTGWPSNETTRVVEVATPIPGSFFGLPDVLRHFGFGKEKNSSSHNSTLRPITFTSGQSPTASPSEMWSSGGRNETDDDVDEEGFGNELLFDNETAYFPIPGLKIGFDNKTGKSFLLFDQDSAIPTVFVPPAVAQRTGLKEQEQDEGTPTQVTGVNITVSDQDDPDDEGGRSNKRTNVTRTGSSDVSYLYYPLIPVNVRLNSMSESGFASLVNESQLLIRMANGSLIRAGGGGDHARDQDFSGFRRSRSPASLVTGEGVGGAAAGGEVLVKKERTRRTTEDSIPTYFSLIQSLDVMDCFSRLVCEIGANVTLYGKYGRTVGHFFSGLNSSHYEPESRASHYIGRFHFGREGDLQSCSRGSPCRQDLLSLVQPLND